MATMQSTLRLTLLDQVSGRMRAMSTQIGAFQNRMRAAYAPLGGVTTRLVAFSAGYLGVTAGMRGTAGAAMRFEEAFADVRKVLDGTPGQLQEVRHQILELSKQLPNSAEGLAAIYAQAAQSNIPLRELSKFSEMVAKVSVAWDTSEGSTSDALAKIKNQLNLSVSEIGLYADAINHLGNNTAAKAPDLVDFAQRVAATGEMFGFTREQTLAFGGAMVASGAQTEVASTSFRNMGRALTIGARATKQNQTAFKRLGIDAVATAKNMQKNALETTLDVLDRIGRLPEWERISIASALFGDEARALMPVIANSTELRRQIGLVGDEANYAGSAFEEYLVRAETTGNALAIIGNKIKAVFREWGEGMLPSIKALGAGLGDVLDTLGQRVGIFDKIKAGFDGLMGGLGYGGPDGLRAMVNDIGDILFGKVFEGPEIADPTTPFKDAAARMDNYRSQLDPRVNELARISKTFRELGKSIQEFTSAVAENPVTKFLAELAGSGFKLFLAASGITIVAGAISKLAKAMWVLSGAAAAVGIIKALAGIGGALWKGAKGGGASAGVATGGQGPQSRGGRTGARSSPWGAAQPASRGGPTGPHMPQISYRAPSILQKLRGAAGRGLLTWAATYIGETAINAGLEAVNSQLYTPQQREDAAKRLNSGGIWSRKFWLGDAAEPGFNFRDHNKIDAGMGGPQRQVEELQSIREALQAPPSGTQDVRVTNPVRPNVNVNVTVHANTNASADDIGRATGERVRAEIEGSFSDGGGGW